MSKHLNGRHQTTRLIPLDAPYGAGMPMPATERDEERDDEDEDEDDNRIVTRVRAVLDNPNLHDAEIDVEAHRGCVQLSGVVASSVDIVRSTVLARGVKGVKSVANVLRLK